MTTGLAAAVEVADEQAPPPRWPVDPPRWEGLVRGVLGACGVRGEVEVAVRFVDPDAMAELNERFMGHEGPTDVLSFPIDGPAALGPAVLGPDSLHLVASLPAGAGQPPPLRDAAEPRGGPPVVLGDVVVCPEVAASNAPAHAGSYEDEVALLVVHGLLHVLGLDHADPAERDRMWAAERALLDQLHGPLAADPWAG